MINSSEFFEDKSDASDTDESLAKNKSNFCHPRNSHNLTQKEVNYVCHFDFKTNGFYGLPKIHKSKIICQEAKVQKKPYNFYQGS